MILTDVEFNIIGVLLDSEKPLTSYKSASDLKTYSQNIEHRLEKLVKFGLLQRISEKGKTKYMTHEVLKCRKCLQDIATHIGVVADIIEGHGETDNGGLNAILYFMCHRVTFTKGNTKVECNCKT